MIQHFKCGLCIHVEILFVSGFFVSFFISYCGFFPPKQQLLACGCCPFAGKILVQYFNLRLLHCRKSNPRKTCTLRTWVQDLTGTLFSRCLESIEEIHECSLVLVIWRTFFAYGYILRKSLWEQFFCGKTDTSLGNR